MRDEGRRLPPAQRCGLATGLAEQLVGLAGPRRELEGGLGLRIRLGQCEEVALPREEVALRGEDEHDRALGGDERPVVRRIAMPLREDWGAPDEVPEVLVERAGVRLARAPGRGPDDPREPTDLTEPRGGRG